MDIKTVNNSIVAVLVLLWITITGIKFAYLGYDFDSLIPRKAYDLSITTTASGYGSEVAIEHFLPTSELGQTLENERIDAGMAAYTIDYHDINRKIRYTFPQAYGKLQTRYTVRVRPREITYTLPEYLKYPLKMQGHLRPFLQSTELIQKDDSLIVSTARRLGLDTDENAVSIVNTIFHYVNKDIRSANFSGETDAVLTCKLGEASCNGKSRLMVALCRHMGIPARLVGGVILEHRPKKTSHQWVEVHLGDYWIPFCPLNGYYAHKPKTYLAAYRGDHAYFRRTRKIAFDYRFNAVPHLVPKEQVMGEHGLLDIVNVWQIFEKAGIPLDLLRFVLIIPIGALVTILFRNVIGLQTYGTFLPALIASAFLGTGLVWGTTIFVVIISMGALLNAFLNKLKLLHTPKLTIVMVFVVVTLLSFSMVGITYGRTYIARSFFFPLAILTITIERFFVISLERGLKKSFLILGASMVVVAFCYMVMSSLFLQMVMVILPETYLLVLACSIYLGRWTGLRMSEFYRFRHLVFSSSPREVIVNK